MNNPSEQTSLPLVRHLNLYELVSVLKSLPQHAEVSPGFGKAHSYRGYYERVAFSPLPKARVEDMLLEARCALGSTYSGWKGGEYQMHEGTLCHISACGVSDEGTEITGATVNKWRNGPTAVVMPLKEDPTDSIRRQVLVAAGRMSDAAKRVVGGRDFSTGFPIAGATLLNGEQAARNLLSAVEEYDAAIIRYTDADKEMPS